MKNYFVFEDWMSRLEIDNCGMLVFAIIYGCCKDKGGKCAINTAYFNELTGYSEASIISSIHDMILERLITVNPDYNGENPDVYEYSVTPKAERLKMQYSSLLHPQETGRE